MKRIVIVAVLLLARTAWAQDSTSGAIRGVVTDAATGDPLPGVTVIAESPALQGEDHSIARAIRTALTVWVPICSTVNTVSSAISGISATANHIMIRRTVNGIAIPPGIDSGLVC